MIEGRSLWELVDRRRAATPDDLLAVDEDGRVLSFADLHARAEQAAAGLLDLDVKEGTVVTWQLPTWLESMVLVVALARLGAVQNPVLPIYRGREVGFVTRQAGTSLVIVPSVWRGFDFEAMARGLGPAVLVADRSLPAGDPATLPPPPVAPDDAGDAPVRWLFYTSGTTADPKGARHTDRTIMAAARGMAERLAVTPGDRSAMVFPFTHIGGITWLFSSLLVGSSNILVEVFDPVTTTAVLAREGVTMAGAGTPFHLAYLNAQRADPATPLFPDVRVFPGGGAPKPPQLHLDLKAELGGVGIVSGYGLTEAPILTMASVHDSDAALADTEGRPMPGVELRVVAPDGTVAGPGGSGEIVAKAPQLMKGYLDTALDTDAFDADGYFRTGDIGHQDPAGNVVVTGRLKDIIIRKGENISAKEVEDLLYTHPKVADVAVIGLPDPDSGERACAVVASRDAGDALDFGEMVAFLKEKGLMNQKIPEQLEAVESVPRNPSGKILKTELRKRYADAG
ncbi:MAG: AMP-binding protein [Acidimicrobiia bacterium]|nr:AMP-binding protein [Acidimicrobiia bacterium]